MLVGANFCAIDLQENFIFFMFARSRFEDGASFLILLIEGEYHGGILSYFRLLCGHEVGMVPVSCFCLHAQTAPLSSDADTCSSQLGAETLLQSFGKISASEYCWKLCTIR